MKTKLLLTILTLCSGLSLLGQIPNYVPQNGLVAWYPFNGNANDESGNGNNGISNNVALEQDRNGNPSKALGFWNSNSNVTIQSITQSGIFQYSVTGWFKKSSGSINQEGGIFCGSNPCNGPGGLRLHIGSTNQAAFGAEYQNCSSVWAYSQNQNYADNIWHHFAVVFNSQLGQIIFSQFLIYIDGIQIQSVPYYQGNTSVVTSPINNNGIPTILGNAFGGGDHFKGLLDDIGIWNRALTLQEITNLYTVQAPCQNTSSVNSASITQGETYSFNGQNLTTAGTYTATLQNAAGCDSLVSLNLVVNSDIANIFAQDTIKACGSSFTLNAASGFNNYLWSLGATTQSINITNTGWYKCTASNGVNSGSDSVFVSLVNANILNGDTTICSGGMVNLKASSSNSNSTYNNTTVTDIDGNIYPIVNIGQQKWMQKNLNVSHYKNGDIIPQVSNDAEWENLNTGAWCWYNNDSSSYAGIYGKLYNWYAVNDPRGLMPIGWKVPADSDWVNMAIYLGFSGWSSPNDVGGKLKETGNNHWFQNYGASNSTGFTGLPGGSRTAESTFGYIGRNGNWWTSTPYVSNSSWLFALSWNVDWLSKTYHDKKYGFSVRGLYSSSLIYSWSTGATSQSINVSPIQTTTYYCTVSNGISSCIDSVTVYVNQPSAITETVSACGSFTWKGNTYSQSGTHTWTGSNAAGCDSVVTLNLTITPQPIQPPTACYQTATFNTSSCSWDVTGTQPVQPPTACYQTATFNTSSCSWDVTGTQPVQPPTACYQTATFNTQSCSWDVTGNPAPAIVTIASACESYTWEANGQTYSASGNYSFSSNCQDYTLNLTIAPQPPQPPTACYQTATFNTQTCSWELTGTLGNASLPSNLQQGLVGYWPFNGNANDVSGNSFNANVLGCSLTSDRNGNASSAYDFNGNGQYMTIPGIPSISGAAAATFSSWVKVDGANTNTNCALGCSQFLIARDPDFSAQSFYLAYGQGNQKFGGAVSNFYGVLSSQTFSNPFSSWVHVTWAIGEGAIKMYLNGQLSNSSNYNGIIPVSSGNLYFGFNPVGGFPYYLNGQMDDIAIWNRVLTASEIQQLHSQNGNTTEPPSTACYETATFNNQTCSWDVTGSPAPAIVTNASDCVSYTWEANGATYNTSGQYSFNSNCQDYTLNLTINLATTSTVNANITQGETYSFNGQNLTTAGTYTATLQNAAGCDSVVTLNLTVEPAVEPLICEITANETSICLGQSSILIIENANSNSACASESLPSNLQNGLVAWFPFCGNAQDASGNGHDGVVLGADLSNDRFGNTNSAYSFNGTSDYILANEIPEMNGASEYSYGAWVKHTGDYSYPNCASGCAQFIVSRGWDVTSGNFRLGFAQPAGFGANGYKWFTGANALTGGTLSNEPNPVPQTEWSFVLAVKKNNLLNLYVNGVLNSSSSVQGALGSNNSPLIIGKHILNNYPYFMNGFIDDVVVFNRALSENEVVQLMNYQPNNSSTLWSTGETTPSISVSPTETTTYSVTVTQGGQTCTSDVTIAVNQPTTETVNASITEGETYSFNGQNLTTAGTYTASLQNAAGCDSVVTLNLTVNPAPVAGCYASLVVNFNQGPSVLGSAVSVIRSNANQALGQPEAVVTNVVNFVSLGFGGTITVAFETPIANGAGNDIRLDEATWGNNPCSRYPEKADVFASQDGTNFIYLGQACQDASFDLGSMSWAKYIRLVDVSDILSFNNDADGFDLNGIECLNGSANNPSNDGLEACTLQEIVSYTPGNRKNGTAIPSPRNNANNALGMPQSNNTINFVALGFGGTLVAKFDYVVFNQPGNDLQVTETSFGNPSCTNYPEKARVSLSLDNQNWVEFGEICQDGAIDMGAMPYAQYIRIQDATPISSSKFNGSADGYDVDAVVVLNNGCGTSSARLSQLDNTTTPDEALIISAFPNPMEDYTIVTFEGLESDADFNFQIMDASGRLVRNENIRVSANNPTYLFNASELARGIYQVVLSNEKGNQIIRLVK